MFCLLPGKRGDTYTALYRQIKVEAAQQNLNIEWKRVRLPTRIQGESLLIQCITDYESGVLSTFAPEFPGCEHSTCYFHFCQSCLRWVRKKGFQNDYDDPNNDSYRVGYPSIA